MCIVVHINIPKSEVIIMMSDEEKNKLFDKLNVNAYEHFDFDLPYYLLQGLASYLEDYYCERKIKWRDVMKLIHLAEEEHRISPNEALFLVERYHRKEKKNVT